MYDSFFVFVFVFDCVNVFLCFFVVLWRFKIVKNGSLGYKRERIFCFVFVIFFIVSGILIVGLLIKRIVEKDYFIKMFCIVVVLSVGCFLYILLVVM